MFKNRMDAGKQLAAQLKQYKNNVNAIVIGLPRGGVVVAFEVAKNLGLPLDIIASRKISMPGNPEAAIGAVTLDGHKVLDNKLISSLSIKQDYIDKEIAKEIKEAERRTKVYRANRTPLNASKKNVIIVDDGIATGSTMAVAIQSIRSQKPNKIIIAVPVAPAEFLSKITPEVDDIICLEKPLYFYAVGQVYENFGQTSDEEVIRLMGKIND